MFPYFLCVNVNYSSVNTKFMYSWSFTSRVTTVAFFFHTLTTMFLFLSFLFFVSYVISMIFVLHMRFSCFVSVLCIPFLCQFAHLRYDICICDNACMYPMYTDILTDSYFTTTAVIILPEFSRICLHALSGHHILTDNCYVLLYPWG